jgi:wobble nucleotide-excising tRNase
MKLQRIQMIHHHRVFRNFIWPSELVPFSSFNLIYGWNGSGKTTLSNLLRAIEDRTAITEGEVAFEINGKNIGGNDLHAHAACLPQVRVFNRDSVARNVFETPGTENLPPIFVLGEDNVAKQTEIDSLSAQLPAMRTAAANATSAATEAERRLGSFAADRAREIKNLLTASGGAYNFYDAARFKADIASFARNQALTLDDETREKLLALRNAEAKELLDLPSISFPDLRQLHSEVQSALHKTVVSSVIEELAAEPGVASWVGAGLKLHTHSGDAATCKFCEQPLPAERLRRLEAHFNDCFDEFAEELDRLEERIATAANALEVKSFPDSKLLYPDLQANFERQKGSLYLHLSNVRQGLSGLARAVGAKKQRVFERLALDDLLLGGDGATQEERSFFNALLSIVVAGLPAISEWSGKHVLEQLAKAIKDHNHRTESFHEEVRKAREQLLRHEVGGAMADWNALNDAKACANATKKGAEDIVSGADMRLVELEAAIRQHAPMAEQLNRDLIAYLGHDEIQVRSEKTGYQVVRRGVPATHLSEGERTAIAFLHFLSTLSDHSFDIKTSIVVVDDPVSSLDSNSVYSAFGFLKSKVKDANQLFVLTHNHVFFRQVCNWFRSAKPKGRAQFYMLRSYAEAEERCSTIQELDLFLREHESDYHYLFKRVVEASALDVQLPLAHYYELPNLARRLLETYLAFKVPDEASLHARLAELAFDGGRKARIERFVQTHSHANHVGDANDDAAALAEAPAVMRDLLALIQATDGDHYARIRAAICQ